VKRPALSLKGRALAWLAQREHSRSELRTKLLRHLRNAENDDDADPDAIVEPLLDRLEQQGYLSDARFVESRVNARAARYGNLRIRQELSRHGVALTAGADQQLKETELTRACKVWQRKFGGEAAADAQDRAKQMRFLAARGFSADVIRTVVRGTDNDSQIS
jgi:regulatory protein